MIEVKLSNIKPQSVLNNSESIQVISFTYVQQPTKATSQKINKEIKNAEPKQETVTRTDPFGPIFLPNKPAVIEPTKGKNNKLRYIKFKFWNNRI